MKKAAWVLLAAVICPINLYAQETGSPEDYVPDAAYESAINATNSGDFGFGNEGYRRGGGRGASGATVDMHNDRTFDCRRPTQRVTLQSGTELKMTSPCTPSGITLSRCDTQVKQGRGCRASEWSDPFPVSAGSQTVNDDLTINAACADNQCALSIKQTTTIQEDPGEAAAGGNQKIAAARADQQANGGNAMASVVYDKGTDDDYNAAHQTVGVNMARGYGNTYSGAQAGRIVSGSGEDMGSVDEFPTYQCRKHCVDKTTTQYTDQETCQTETNHKNYICTKDYGTAHCSTQMKMARSSCTQNRDVDVMTCQYDWPDPEQTPVRTCPGGLGSGEPGCPVNDRAITCGSEYAFDTASGTCKGEAACGDGFDYNVDQDQCEKMVYVCQDSGYDYNIGSGQCEKTVFCQEDDYNYDPDADQCVRNTATCPDPDFNYNPDADQCEKTGPTCPDSYVYNEAENQCEKAVTACRYGGNYNPDTNKCEQARTCDDGYHLAGDGQTCLANQPSCQVAGDTFSGADANIRVTNAPGGDSDTNVSSGWSGSQLTLHYDSKGYACGFLGIEGNPRTVSWTLNVGSPVENIQSAVISHLSRRSKLVVKINGSQVLSSGNGCGNTNNPPVNAGASTNILPYLQTGNNTVTFEIYSGNFNLFGANTGAPLGEITLDVRMKCDAASSCPVNTGDAGDGKTCVADQETYVNTIPPREGVIDSHEPTIVTDTQPTNPTVLTKDPTEETQTQPPSYPEEENNDIENCRFVDQTCPDDDPFCTNNKQYNYACEDVDSPACGDPLLADGWVEENTFARHYKGGHMTSWKVGYSKDNGWGNASSCAQESDPGCTAVGVSCSAHGPVSDGRGAVADYDCISRERKYQCETGNMASTCENNGTGSCEKVEDSCKSQLEMDVKVCHYERGRIQKRFECPAGFDHDPNINMCSADQSCPEGSVESSGDSSICILTGGACTSTGERKDVDSIISVTDSHGTGKDVELKYINEKDQIKFAGGGGGSRCRDKFNSTTFTFDLEVPLSSMLMFKVVYSKFDDGGAIYLNGHTLLDRGLGQCGHAVRGAPANIPAAQFLKQKNNVLRIEYTSGQGGNFGSVFFQADWKCTTRKSCPIGTDVDSAGKCSTPGVVLGNPPGSKNIAYCPAGYVEKAGKCRKDVAQCNTAESLGGRDGLNITRSEVLTPDGETVDMPPVWNTSGTSFSINYADSSGKESCTTGWRYHLGFTLPEGKEMIDALRLDKILYDDSVTVKVNGKTVFSTPDGCDNYAGGKTITPGVDLKPHLVAGENDIEIKAISTPPGINIAPTFTVKTSCTTPKLNRNTVTAGSCHFEGKECPEGDPGCEQHEDFVYDCGEKPYLVSNCTDSAVAGWNYESRSNKRTNEYGRLIGWDDAYSRNERWTSAGCEPESSPDGACTKTSQTCTQPDSAIINGAQINRDCFQKTANYQCYPEYNAAACTNTPVPGDCSFSGESCVRKNPKTGACLENDRAYVCETTGTTQSCNGTPADTGQCTEARTGCSEKDAYGNCVKEATTRDCYTGKSPRCMADDKCTYDSSECVTTEGGICTEVKQTYNCEKTRVTCEKTVSSCGDPEDDDDGEGFQKVVAATGTVDSTMGQLKKGATPDELLIMDGKPMRCTKSIGDDVGVGADCCDLKADDVGIFDACTKEEQDLAPARRAKRTHYNGKYCSKKIDVGFGKICIERSRTYCMFSSKLARIINEQGRQQLADVASSAGGSLSQTSRTYPYMSDEPGWNTTLDVQGQTMAFWTWDSQCKGATKTAYTDDGLVCPGPQAATWVAYCDGDDCPAEALRPPYGHGNDTDWKFNQIPASGKRGVPAGRNAQIGGDCLVDPDDPENGTCTMNVTSWPQSASGNVRVAMDVSWQLFHPVGNPDNWASSVKKFGRFRFQPYQSDPGDERTLPETVPLRVSVDDAPFQTIDVPTVTPYGGYKLPTTPESWLFGECSLSSNYCQMRVMTYSVVKPKPWCPGGHCPHKPSLDCSGFTIEEFALLDFSKMDLSEFTDTALASMDMPDQDKVKEQMATSMQGFRDDYASGNSRESNDSEEKVMQVSPTDGRPPWEVTAQFASQYPATNGDVAVQSIIVDWGDGSSTVISDPGADPDLMRKHTYTEADGYRRFDITATFTLSGGQKTSTQATVESWKDDPPGYSGNLGGGGGNAHESRPDATSGGYPSSSAGPAKY